MKLNMIYADRNDPYTVPLEVAKCPACDAPIVLDLNEWEQDEQGILPTSGCTFSCSEEPDISDEAARERWEDAHSAFDNMPYVYWMPIEQKALAWIRANVRFTDCKEDKYKCNPLYL